MTRTTKTTGSTATYEDDDDNPVRAPTPNEIEAQTTTGPIASTRNSIDDMSQLGVHWITGSDSVGGGSNWLRVGIRKRVESVNAIYSSIAIIP